jgi:hypothetical protein
MSGKN